MLNAFKVADVFTYDIQPCRGINFFLWNLIAFVDAENIGKCCTEVGIGEVFGVEENPFTATFVFRPCRSVELIYIPAFALCYGYLCFCAYVSFRVVTWIENIELTTTDSGQTIDQCIHLCAFYLVVITSQTCQCCVLAHVKCCQLVIVAVQCCQCCILAYIKCSQLVVIAVQYCQCCILAYIKCGQLVVTAIQACQCCVLAHIKCGQLVSIAAQIC